MIIKNIPLVVILLILLSACDNEKQIVSEESETTIPSEGVQEVTPRPIPDPYPTY